jgi:hypothetical protein
MLASLWSVIRDTFGKLSCKLCDKKNKMKTVFATRLLWHLRKVHKVKPTKKDIKFLLRYNLISRLFFSLVAIILFVPLFILKFVLLPLYYLYEIL